MLRVNPHLVSWIAFLAAVGAGTAFFLGGGAFLGLALLLVLVNSYLDALDGKIAKMAGKASARGDFLDHVFDRYADVFMLGGIAFNAMYCRLEVGTLALLGVLLTSYMGTQAQAVGQGRAYGGILGRAHRPAPMPKTTATITIKNPRRPPRKGTAARNGARATTTMIPPTVKPRKAPRNPNPSDFPISFRRNPVRNPMTSPPMRIQYAPSPAPRKVSRPNTIPSAKPINQTIPSFILAISCCPVASPGADGQEGQGYMRLASRLSDLGWNSSPRRTALRRRRRALAPWPLLAALHPIILQGMLDRQANPIGAWADAV